MIRAKDVSYEYIRRNADAEVVDINRAVDGISLQIDDGQFIAILGHNGSGKSTFAKHLNALLTPSEGTIWVNSWDTSEEEHVLDIRTSAGMVFQNPDNQIVANIVEEDVGFGPENMGIPTSEIWTRVKTSLKSVGMLSYRKDSPNRLSGGQKQRVAIAGVIAMKPECIILDEPTAMLDPSGRREVLRTIHELNQKEHITVILITHYMEEAMDADRIFVMEKGKVVMHGGPREIFSRVDELQRYRLTLPQVTKISYELKQKGLPIPDGILSVEELVNVLKPLCIRS